MNELDETVWNETVRPIRTRAGFTAESALEFPGKDQEKLRAVIRYERRAEFVGEGYYYNDLRRWREAENVNNGPIRSTTMSFWYAVSSPRATIGGRFRRAKST